MIYSWTFKNLRTIAAKDTLTDVAISIDYRIAATANKTTWAYYYGTIVFAPADPDAFIEFNAITKDDMIAFVEQSLGSAALDAIKAELQQALTNPTELKPLPWESRDETME